MTTTLDAIPRWVQRIELHSSADGGAFVETLTGDRCLWVGDDELALVALVDGRLTMTELAQRALVLDPPLTPERTAALIHGLELAGLVESLAAGSEARPAPSAHVTGLRRDGWLIPGSKTLSEQGKHAPAYLWRPLAGVFLLAALVLFGVAAGQGLLAQLLSPLPHGRSVAPALGLLLLGASLTLSLRSVVAGLTLRSLGQLAPPLALRFRWALPHLALPQRSRRRLPQAHRLTLGLVGLAACACMAVLWGVLSLSGRLWAQPLSAVAWLIFAIHLAPHWRTDARTALGAATRLPGLAASAVLFSRQASRPSPYGVTADPARRTVALTATLLVLHSLAMLYAMVFVVVPDTLHHAISSLLLQPGLPTSFFERTLASGFAVTMVLALLVLWVVLLRNALRSVVALLTPGPRQTVVAGQGDPQTARLLQHAAAFRALLGLTDDVWTAPMVASVQLLAYKPDDVVSAAGQPAPGVGVVIEGELVVLEQDIAGVPFESGHLREGDLVGVEHMSPFLPAPWLLRATTPVRLAMLPPDVAVAASAQGTAAMVLAVLVRHTALAATPPGRLAKLLTFSTSTTLPAHAPLPSTPDDTLWVVVAGGVLVPAHGDEPERILASPTAVGSFARQVLSAGQRSRLRAGEHGAKVVGIPVAAIRQLLQESLRSGARPTHRTRHTLAALRLQTGAYDGAEGDRP